MPTDTDTCHDSALQGVSTLWRVAFEGIVRDSFWSRHSDAAAAKEEYCNARHWIARDRVTLL